MLNIYNPQNNQGTEISKTPKPVQSTKTDYRSYVDPTGEFDSKELGYSIWFVKHKVLLYRAILVILITFNAILWFTGILKWIAYGFDYSRWKKMEISSATFVNYRESQSRFAPKDLIIQTANLYAGGVNKLDAISEIENPNSNFIATVDYSFHTGLTTTPPASIKVLPGSKNFIAFLGIPETEVSQNVSLQVLSIKWKRVSPHKIPNPLAWQDERLKFTISSTTFQNTIGDDGTKVNRVSFKLKNETAFGYKQPKFYVGLYNQDVLTGLLPLQTEDFKSLEEKNVDLRNFSTSLQVQSIQIFPLVDLYDTQIYLQPEK